MIMKEKKCVNCDHMTFCIMYKMLRDMAGILNANMDDDIAGNNGFINMVNNMARECNRFYSIKD